MGNITNNQVICKCLDLLALSDERDKTLDFRAQKLTTAKLVKLMIEAQLRQHNSYGVIVEHLRSSGEFQHLLDLESISTSQISRKLRKLPYTYSQVLFLHATQKLQQLTNGHKGVPNLGRLKIVDSSMLTLPAAAGQWAYCSKHKNAVKMHTRIIVTDNDTVFPDRIIASTADVADSEVVMDLVAADDAIYVMDRGYIVYKNYKAWTEQNARFVARIQKRNKTVVVRERPVPKSSKITRDADVKVSFKEDGEVVEVELRLVEFDDDKGNHYRLLTNVNELSAEQISEIYRHRWMIELFFKWIKQHLKLVKLYSVEPEASLDPDVFGFDRICLGPHHPVGDRYNKKCLESVTTTSALHAQELGYIPPSVIPKANTDIQGSSEEKETWPTSKASSEAKSRKTDCELTTINYVYW